MLGRWFQYQGYSKVLLWNLPSMTRTNTRLTTAVETYLADHQRPSLRRSPRLGVRVARAVRLAGDGHLVGPDLRAVDRRDRPDIALTPYATQVVEPLGIEVPCHIECHVVPRSANCGRLMPPWCRVLSRFWRRFYRPIRDILRGHGRRH